MSPTPWRSCCPTSRATSTARASAWTAAWASAKAGRERDTVGRRGATVVWDPRAMRDLVIRVNNEPGALARVTAAISDAGVNLSAATCIGGGDYADLHVLVKHVEATRRVLEPAG